MRTPSLRALVSAGVVTVLSAAGTAVLTPAAGGGCDMNRSTRAQKFTWNADGTPSFGTPARLGVTLTAPSGE